MILTEEQDAIRSAARDLKDRKTMKVIAFAGAGKTSTLKAVASARSDKGLYLAFNKDIAKEAQQKFRATRASASTFNSLAYRSVQNVFAKDNGFNLITADAHGIEDSGVLNDVIPPRVPWEGMFKWGRYRFASAVGRTISNFCAGDTKQVLDEHARQALIESVGDPLRMQDGEPKARAEQALDKLTDKLVEAASEFFKWSIETGNMSHDIYLKSADLFDFIRRDMFLGIGYIMVDEAQDLNPVQRSIIEKSGCNIIAVGDPWQQIYSWRGAENALASLSGESYFLTGSFRFGENIADIARKILESHPEGGPEKRLEGLGDGAYKNWDGIKAATICRTNAGVIEAAMNFMNKGIPTHVANMDQIVKDVKSALALHENDLDKVKSPLFSRYASWDEAKIDAEDGSDAQLSRMVDLVESGQAYGVLDVDRNRVKDDDIKKARVTICTAHKSKGLEWPAVKIWSDFKPVDKMVSRYNNALGVSDSAITAASEEWNTLYVAATRSIARVDMEPKMMDSIMTPPRDDRLEVA